MSKLVILLTAALALGGAAACAHAASLAEIEGAYADFNDATGAIGLIESGLRDSHEGRTRSEWVRLQTDAREYVLTGLKGLPEGDLSQADRRAVEIMQRSMADSAEDGSLAPVGKCEDAQRKDITYAAMRVALYACFGALSNSLDFEGQKVTRVGAFDLLTRMEEPQRRKQLFLGFVPLWQAINGKNERDSPYRRLIVMAAADARTRGSAIDAAAKTVGARTPEVETWLVQILDAWRQASGKQQVEPWDYRYLGGATERELGDAVAREAMQPLNERYYRDLGTQLSAWDVIYDLDPREGKAPLAYTDYVSRGRWRDDKWVPTLVRVSGNYAHGGLGLLNELVHENGHVVHMMALQTRPAFMDLGDPLFYEAFADVPSWSTYEPAWQQKYLGRSSTEESSLRGLYSSVMLDVAWALFEARMLREPTRDPNVVWTEITSRYLHVKPHPELAWWLVRVQLVDAPGYMVNYGLGAMVTADLRQRIAEQIGPFATGNERWFPWLAEHLLSSGQTEETAVLLREFLGRPVSSQALLNEIARIKKKEMSAFLDRAHDTAVHLLSTVPGLPPIVQTVHLLGIAIVLGSVVLLDLRILGLALPSQDVRELTQRVMPWLWCTLPVMVLSGLPFVLARPERYLSNPVFGWKFALLLPAIALAAVVHVVGIRRPDYWQTRRTRAAVRAIAAASLLLWTGVVFAGRWIAYADYLFDV